MSFVIEGFTAEPEIKTDRNGVTKTLTLQRHPRPLFQTEGVLGLENNIEVFVGPQWGTWIKTDLAPQWVVWSTAESGIGRAELLNRYGERFQSGDAGDVISEDEEKQFSWHPTVDYHEQFIKIVIGGGGSTKVGDIESVPPPGGSLFKRVWIGQIDAQGAALAGASTKHPTGIEVLHATSIEQAVFGRHFVTTSEYVEYDNPTRPQSGRVKVCRHGMTFNENGVPNQDANAVIFDDGTLGHARGRGRFMTRPGRGYPQADLSSKFPREITPVFWTTQDIVEYAIRTMRAPAPFGPSLFTVEIPFDDLFRLPNWDQPVIETHGHRPLEILRRVMSRRRLLMWRLELKKDADPLKNLDALNNPILTLSIQTTTIDPVQATRTQSIPGNLAYLSINADPDPGARSQVDHNGQSIVHQVIAQGDRRRNVMSLSFETPDSRLANDAPIPANPNPTATHRGDNYWTVELEEAYEKGASETDAYKALLRTDRDEKKRLNDLERSRDKYADVFTRFGMNYRRDQTFSAAKPPVRINYPIKPALADVSAWGTGNVYFVGTRLKEGSTIIEVVTSSGNVSNGSGPFADTNHSYEIFYENCFGNIRLLQKTPLFEGRDYSGTNIADGTTAANAKDVLPKEIDMFVLFWSEAKVKPGSDKTEGKFIWASKTSQMGLNPPKEGEDRDLSATVRVVEEDTSFRIKVSGKDTKPHSIAKGTLRPLADAGFQEWEAGRFYTIGTIVKSAEFAQFGENTYHEVTGGDGPSAGNGKALDDGSDTGYTYGPAIEKPMAMNIDDDEVGKIDWRQMRATICYEDDRFCESVFPAYTNAVASDAIRVMRIDLGKAYQLHWVEKDTVVDINEEGQLITSNGGFIRDDRQLIENVARQAYAFYSRLRGVLSLSLAYRDESSELVLGKMIKRIRGGSVDENVNDPNSPPNFVDNWVTVEGAVTELRVDIPYTESSSPAERVGPITMSLKTTFGELDPRFFVRGARRR